MAHLSLTSEFQGGPKPSGPPAEMSQLWPSVTVCDQGTFKATTNLKMPSAPLWQPALLTLASTTPTDAQWKYPAPDPFTLWSLTTPITSQLLGSRTHLSFILHACPLSESYSVAFALRLGMATTAMKQNGCGDLQQAFLGPGLWQQNEKD